MGLVWRKDDLLTLSEEQLSMANETCQQKIASPAQTIPAASMASAAAPLRAIRTAKAGRPPTAQTASDAKTAHRETLTDHSTT